MNNSAILEIDLVFNCSDTNSFKNFLKDKQDQLIIKKEFWENIFLSWIKIIIEEYSTNLNNTIKNKKSFSMSLQIINDKEICELKHKWLNKDLSTDVLSFPILVDEDINNNLPFIELGDLFISFETAYDQSIKYMNSLKKEMLWLASHGLLHLLGWEHNNKKELDEMINFQEYLISKLIE